MATQVRQPTGNGTNDNWTASAGNKWECVDEGSGSPNDGDYISRADSNGQQYLTFANFSLPAGATVNKVYVTARLKEIGALNLLYGYSDGTLRTANAASDTTYQTFTNDWTTNPATSAAWTKDEAEALTIMVLATSSLAAGESAYCSQIEIGCDYTEAASGHPARKRLGGIPFAAVNQGVW
jgi:hypothetical protein